MPTSLKYVALAVAVLLTAGIVALVTTHEPPRALEQISEAQTKGAEAQETSEKIAATLEDLASNLREGRDLSSSSDEIHSLTERQRRSLGELLTVLEDQLDALRRSSRSLEATEETTTRVAELSERQAALIETAVAALRRLAESALTAGNFSADVARLARYAARLAEDSAEAFSP